ncbi:hypothetical protein [Rhodoferax sp. GW822-FHT02A01]|uniref:COG4648 family protein n=1 Tax=Rhodoferax sp. GW822-FHT02A01 TaxID=3141537 RepID=UPI00315DBBF4
MSIKQSLGLALLAIVGATYLGLSYTITVAEHPTLAMLAFSIAPLATLALASAWNAKARGLALGLFAVAAIVTLLNLEPLRAHTAWLYFIQHAGTMTLLCLNFGRTLGHGHENALCSRLTTLILHTSVDARYMYYTWKVTLAWTIYFGCSALLSVVLFFGAPIAVWSVFADLLTPLLIGAMFVGEYLIRVRTMPQRMHFSIAETIRAYRKQS